MSKQSFRNLYESDAVKKHVKSRPSPTEHATSVKYGSRILISGASGTGKTHALATLITLSPDTWHKVVVVSQNIEEPLYEMLREQLKDKIVFYTLASMPPVKTLVKEHREDDEDQVLLVFDDLINDAKHDLDKIRNSFVYGRKLGLTMVWITQSYFATDTTIRRNQTHLILLRQSSVRDLNNVLSDFHLGVSKEQLKEMYRVSTREDLNFLLVNCQTNDRNKRFSHNFGDYWLLPAEDEDEDGEGNDEH